MSNLIVRTAAPRIFNAFFVSALLVLAVSGASRADPGDGTSNGSDEVRSSVTRHISPGGLNKPSLTSETSEAYESLVTSGSRATSKTRGGFAKPGPGSDVALSPGNDFWIFGADVELFNDDDNDGYYRSIDLLFDADTIYSAVEVYAVVYLSLDFGPWNEYGMTEEFWIFGTSGEDEYVLITDLMSGYPTGDYDLLIEIFDAGDNSFLAGFGPDDSSKLGYLPLEDFGKDEPIADIPVAVSHGGGGAADAWAIGILLLLLVASAVRKIWRRRHDVLVRIDTPAGCWDEPASTRRQANR